MTANLYSRTDPYQGYQDHKSWGQAPDSTHDPLFFEEIDSLGLKKGAKIVEVGFGEGRFLDFARRSGFDVLGLEIIPDLVKMASARGHNVSVGALGDLSDQAGTFDLVVAFDVMEHLTTEEVAVFLNDSSLLLKEGGFILIRFPNGNSPFSLWLMNADVTHRSYLSENSIMQLARPLGFHLERASNAKLIPPLGMIKNLRRWLSYSMRSIIEMLICYSFLGRRVPLEPNLVVVLAK